VVARRRKTHTVPPLQPWALCWKLCVDDMAVRWIFCTVLCMTFLYTHLALMLLGILALAFSAQALCWKSCQRTCAEPVVAMTLIVHALVLSHMQI
jgi:hypothetical protein